MTRRTPRTTADRLRLLAEVCVRLLDAERPDPEDLRDLLELDRGHALNVRAWAGLLLILLPDEYRDLPLPARPTNTAPGTVERVAEYVRRSGAGRALWHPGDATLAEPLAADPQPDGAGKSPRRDVLHHPDPRPEGSNHETS